MKLDVPYYSQFLDVKNKEWMPRACGMACVKMTLDFHKVKSLDLDVLIERGYEDGGYSKSGWFHDYFVHLFEEHSLYSKREEKMKDMSLLLENLRGGKPIIISVTKKTFNQTKFHMVVLTGFEEEDSKLIGFYYHDPESMNRELAQHMFVDTDTFLSDWRKMAIFVDSLAS